MPGMPEAAADGSGYRYDMTFSPSLGFEELEPYSGTRTEWVTPGQEWHETHTRGTWYDTGYSNTYARGTATTVDWFRPVTRPAFSQTFPVRPSRYRDFMTVNIQAWTPSGPLVEHGGNLGWGETPTNLKLYQGETLLHENPWASDLQWVEVPAGTLPYRLVLEASRPADPWRLSTRTHTEWGFVSSSNEADNFVTFPLLQLDYDVETDLRGDARKGKHGIGLTAHVQAGAPDAGRVTEVTLEVSYDDGATWQPVDLTAGGDGWWRTDVKPPTRAQYVSLRASASTDAGWSIKQEIIRAYGLG